LPTTQSKPKAALIGALSKPAVEEIAGGSREEIEKIPLKVESEARILLPILPL